MFSRRSFLGAVPFWARAAGQPGGIWDAHCHLEGLPGDSPADRVRELVRFGDRMGIERLVVFMGYPFVYDPSPEELRRQNDQVLAAIQALPERVLGFVYLSPKHVAFSLQEFDRCVRDGPMVGVKLWVARHCNEPELDPIVERASALNAPVLQHTYLKATGNLPGESTPAELAELAQRHPNARLICGHSGAEWETGIRSIRRAANVSIDICGFDPTSGVVETAVREIGVDRILFGSDAPGRSFASQLAKVTGAQISDSSREQILGGNLRRLLGPILKAKGRPL
jgi:predicted TIM-barrel fold metal-dependent hydrolase